MTSSANARISKNHRNGSAFPGTSPRMPTRVRPAVTSAVVAAARAGPAPVFRMPASPIAVAPRSRGNVSVAAPHGKRPATIAPSAKTLVTSGG